MKFIITEEEKKYIKGLYGLISEQETTKKITPIVIPEDIYDKNEKDWYNWCEENIDKNFINGTLRLYVKSRREDLKEKENVQNQLLIDGIRTIAGKEGRPKVNTMYKMINNAGYTKDQVGKEQVIHTFQIFQNMANDVYSKWDEGYEKNMVLTITEVKEQSVGVTVGGTVDFPIEWNPGTDIQLYVNNEWDLSDQTKTAYNQFVTDKINLLKKSYPSIDITLLSLSIETSASRYRNTGRASGLTFQELSLARNNSAKAFIVDSLVTNGVKNTDITPEQKYLGVNKDGTTGPNPPEPNAFVDGGKGVKMDSSPTQERNQFGDPHPTPEEYNQYKYLKVKIMLRATLANEETVTSEFKTFTYELDIDGDKLIPPKPVKVKPKGKKPSGNFGDFISNLFTIPRELCAAYMSGGNF